MKLPRLSLGLALIILILSSCSNWAIEKLSSPAITPSPAQQQSNPGTPAVSPSPVLPPPRLGPAMIRIWLPPQFDPEAGTPASNLIKSRLNEFSSRRPGVRIEVRIKSINEPGGMLESLTTASSAAPQALPDLVAVPHPVLEAAALKGLLHPFHSHPSELDDPDWYDYAREMGHLQTNTFGLPFAGDALVVVYRPSQVKTPPSGWTAALKSGEMLAFPAADPQALFTLVQYQAKGGALRDDQGRPTLNPEVFTQVLEFYQEAEKVNVMPGWLAQLPGDEAAWQAYHDRRTNQVAIWASSFLSNTITNTAVAPVLTPEGEPFTLATGWAWALASPAPERQDLAAQLASFLTETSFLAAWTEAAGYLPPRASALHGWSDVGRQASFAPILASARLTPSNDVLNSLGPPFQAAVIAVIRKQAVPAVAAQAALESLKKP